MDALSSIPSIVMLVALIASVGVKAFALVSSLGFSEEAYAATAKLTKVAWCLILGLSLAAQVIISNPLGLINIVGLVATLVFLADVRPALQRVTRR